MPSQYAKCSFGYTHKCAFGHIEITKLRVPTPTVQTGVNINGLELTYELIKNLTHS